MARCRSLLGVLAAGAAAFCLPAAAQLNSAAPEPPVVAAAGLRSTAWWLPGGRSYLGLNLDRSRYSLACQSTALLCDHSAQLVIGTMAGKFWGVELGYLDMGRIARGAGESRVQGLNLSLVGRASVGPSLGLFGKLGTTYARNDTAVMGASASPGGPGQGFGLSFGGGLSLDLSPRLSATLEWDSNDWRFAGAGREPVRSTSLGLQFKY